MSQCSSVTDHIGSSQSFCAGLITSVFVQLLLEHLEAISPDHNDLLHELLQDLGDVPDVEALLGTVNQTFICINHKSDIVYLIILNAVLFYFRWRSSRPKWPKQRECSEPAGKDGNLPHPHQQVWAAGRGWQRPEDSHDKVGLLLEGAETKCFMQTLLLNSYSIKNWK